MRPNFARFPALASLALATLVAGSLILPACGAGMAPRRDLRSEPGTCEIACDHYEYCKGAPDAQREQACLTDCRTIFSEDGHVDGDSLRQLEELSCSQLLSFIEGPDARAPGSTP